MKKIQSIVIMILGIGSLLSAQPFENEVGVKAGYSSGLTLAHSLNRFEVIELQALYNRHGFQACGIYKYQFSPYDKKQLYYFVGGGIYGGNWEEETALGGTILLGATYYLRKAPIGFGIEWKPLLNLYKNFNYAIPDFGVTIKVIIN